MNYSYSGNHVQSNNNHNNNIANGGTNGSNSTSTAYQNVIYKKVQGTLILTEDSYTFYPIPIIQSEKNSENSKNGNSGDSGGSGGSGEISKNSNSNKITKAPTKQSWSQVVKHQVSPVTHTRHLLKIIISQSNSSQQPINVLFEFKTRQDIEKIRKDISQRLLNTRQIHALNHNNISLSKYASTSTNTTSSTTANEIQSSRKRNHNEFMQSNTSQIGTQHNYGNENSSIMMVSSSSPSSSSSSKSYAMLTKSQFKVASSSLLASYPTLRKQYSFLLKSSSSSSSTATTTTNANGTTAAGDNNNTSIISNDLDFWTTHSTEQSNQLSKIIGVTSRGLPSTIKSSLDIQITTNNNTTSSSSNTANNNNNDKKDSNNNDNSNTTTATTSSSSMPLNISSSAITLGVEEMKQIFIMYPAVHAAYEEKVPLELSEELFWRKYLESEYFHRDRGKLGMSAKMNLLESGGGGGGSGNNTNDDDDNDEIDGGDKDDNDDDKKEDVKKIDESVRVATASSNDIFSRKELELQRLKEQQHKLKLPQGEEDESLQFLHRHVSNKNFAIGQFDLTSTANTERGARLLLHSNADVYPSNNCGKKVIEKYNKHWAMVLNPNEAVAGCDLKQLARKSVTIVLDGDEDANAKGGVDEEMKRLVNSASSFAASSGTNHDNGESISDDHFYYGDNVLIEELKLKNINAYSGQYSQSRNQEDEAAIEKQLEMNVAFSNIAMDQVKGIINPIISSSPIDKITDSLPDKLFGMQLLVALTKKLVEDSKSEKDAAKMTNEMPQEFRNRFIKYFRRSSELLRHFYALRRMMEIEQKEQDGMKSKRNGNKDDKNKQSSQKLERIVTGLVDVYREMEAMRNELPSSDLGEKMRKMFIPVMDQLDWASKLHKDGLTSGPKKTGGFGFVEVTD